MEKDIKKEIFVNSLRRWQNASSMTETRITLLEQALGGANGGDTRIFDYEMLEQLFNSTCDTVYAIFPNIKFEVLKDYVGWYLYEVPSMDNPYIEINDEKGKPKKRFEINTPESLYEFFVQY